MHCIEENTISVYWAKRIPLLSTRDAKVCDERSGSRRICKQLRRETRSIGHPIREVFEAFVTSSLLRKYHQSDTTGMEDEILTGGSGDGGIDAIAISVNGRIASTEEDLQFFFDSHGRLDVEFAFVQTKTSSTFNAAEIGNFMFGVEQFFISSKCTSKSFVHA